MGEIRIDFHLQHPVELVWRALTEPALLTAWFMPVYVEPRPGARLRLDPGDLAGLDGPIDVDVTEVAAPRTLVMQWRTTQMRTIVAWRVAPAADGSRLTITQQGFLGPNGLRRQRALRATYALLFGRRLPAVLDGLAAGGPLPALVRGPTPRPEPAAPPAPRLRSRITSPVMTGLAAAVVGALLSDALFTRKSDPATARINAPPVTPEVTLSTAPPTVGTVVGDPVPLRASAQSAAHSVTVTPSTSAPPEPPPSPSPMVAQPSPAPLTADYAHVEPQLLGYTGEITVRNPGEVAAPPWTVTVTLPPLAVVTRADVGFTQLGTMVTFHGEPLEPGGEASFEFAVRLDVSGLVGATAPVTCQIDETPCGGL